MKNKKYTWSIYFLTILLALAPFAGVKAAARYSDPINISQTGRADSGKIALLADGRACIAFSSANPARTQSQVYVTCQHKDGSWSGLVNQHGPDALAAADRLAFAPQIIIDNQNRPIVSWIQKMEPGKVFVNQQIMTDNSGSRSSRLITFNVRVSRYNGIAWTGLAGPRPSDNATFGRHISARPDLNNSNYSLALNPTTNRPAIAWQNQKSGEIYFRHFNGAKWTGLTANADNVSVDGPSRQSMTPGLAYNLAGQPFVSWNNLNSNTGQTNILLKTFSTGKWQGFNGNTKELISAGHALTLTPNLVIWQNRPVIAWMGHKNAQDAERIYVRSYNGATWRGLTGQAEDLVSSNLIETRSPQLATSVGGGLGIAFSASTSSSAPHHVYYSRWNNTSWQGLAGSAFDQVSLFGDAGQTSLTVDNLFKPHLIWQRTVSGSNGLDVFYSRAY